MNSGSIPGNDDVQPWKNVFPVSTSVLTFLYFPFFLLFSFLFFWGGGYSGLYYVNNVHSTQYAKEEPLITVHVSILTIALNKLTFSGTAATRTTFIFTP